MKKLFAVLLALVLLGTAYVHAENSFEATITYNCWDANTGMNGVTLYSPYIKLSIKNLQTSSASSIKVQAVFYDTGSKSMWSDETVYLISSSDTPLKSGYSKTAFIQSSVGYTSKISELQLPSITAEIYINGTLYGEVTVERSYTSKASGQLLTLPDAGVTEETKDGKSGSSEAKTDESQEGELVEQTIIEGLPSVFVLPAAPAPQALPDPSIFTGEDGMLTYESFQYGEKTYTVRQYSKPADIDSYLREYNALAESKGFEVAEENEMGTPAYSYTDADGKTAIVMYDYGGLMLLMTEEGMEVLKYVVLTGEVGDVLTFGTYEQDNNTANGKEPIEWIILDKRADGSLVLLSKYALDCKPYNTKDTDVTWETCTLREWLNEDFYKAAFSSEEQAKIVPVTLENEDNPNYGTTGGNATRDRVWLLSINEATNKFTSEKVYGYFTDDASRMCAPTKYAVSQGASQNSNYTVDGVGACWWWLRSSGYDSYVAALVNCVGYVDFGGLYVCSDGSSVRPVVVAQPF